MEIGHLPYQSQYLDSFWSRELNSHPAIVLNLKEETGNPEATVDDRSIALNLISEKVWKN
jgi:hypothetical protein